MTAKFLSLSLAAMVAASSAGCVSYSSTERKTVPAQQPYPVVERTIYSDGSYVDRPIAR